MEFVKLVKISGDRFLVRTDDIDDVAVLWEGQLNLVRYILVVSVGSDQYYLDLGRMMNDHPSMLQANNIHEIINQLTYEILYGYQTDVFHLDKLIRTFTVGDLPGTTTLAPYNRHHDGETDTAYDPSFQDLVIRCDDYDMTNLFPIIDGKIRRCSWYKGKMVLEGRVELARTTTHLNLISFSGIGMTTMGISELLTDGVPAGRVPILVLGGSMYYDEPGIYQHLKNQNKVTLNSSFTTAEAVRLGYDSEEEWLNDPDSFVILVEANNIFARDLLMVPLLTDYQGVYCYYEPDVWRQHLDYICIDAGNNHLHGLSAFPDLYLNAVTLHDSNEHHVYVDAPGDHEVRLMQLAVC